MKKNAAARARRKSAPGQVAAPVKSEPVAAHDGGNLASSPPAETPHGTEFDWVRLPKPGESMYGLTRSYLYLLCTRQTVRSITIRQPHNKRGVRLIYRPSIHAFLSSLDREQNGTRE